MMILLEHVSKRYPARSGKNAPMLSALDDVSLHVETGEWIAVMGPSGSGKSTLVNLIGCLDRPSEGRIRLDGEDIADLPPNEMNRVRAEKIGFVFQQFHLIPYLTALENVMLAQYFHSMTDEKEAREALERVGLAERAHHLPGQLSGGEQQRVCIARALINDPKIILADEPTGNLDAQNEEIVLRLLRELHRQGRTIVMVTHDPVMARLADRTVELHHGRISSEQIFSLNDQEQFDEILEQIWVIDEHNEAADVARLENRGALPVSVAVEKMAGLGLLTMREHGPEAYLRQPVLDPCHDMAHPPQEHSPEAGKCVAFTPRGYELARSIIRRHRLAECLFTESLGMQSEKEIEEQACKFEHILSPEATERICAFLGHPQSCPHGALIPPGSCCDTKQSGQRRISEIRARK